MKKLTLLTIMLALLFQIGLAQVSSYSFSSLSGVYTEITGGTLLGSTTSDDQRFVDPAVPLGGTTTTGVGLPIGFNFVYNGYTFDRFAVNTNGWISLGSSLLTPSVNITSSSSYTPMGSTSAITPPELVGRIVALGRDLNAQTGAELRYEVLGTSPNQVLVIQWKNFRKFNATGDSFNFQIQLFETSNVVAIVYGPMTSNATSTTVQVGLRSTPATTATDYSNRTSTIDWAASTAGTIVTASMTLSSTVFPVSGQTYVWTPPTCPAPTSLTATNISATSADLGWTDAGSGLGWNIEWGPTGFTQGTGTLITGTTSNPYNLVGLTPTTTYQFYVQADCGGGDLSNWAGPFSFTTLATCPAPSSLTASGITTSSANLVWTENGSATIYNIEYGLNGFSPTGTPTIFGVSNPYTLSGLLANTIYDYYVQADCGGGDLSTWVGPFTFNTPCLTFTAPYTQDFENGGVTPTCWNNFGTENWLFGTTAGYGPTADHTSGSGYFAWVDDSSPHNNGTTLESPFVDVSGLTTPALYFWLWSNSGTNPNVTLTVDVFDGAVWNNGFFTHSGNVAGWVEQVLDLSSLTITGPVQVRFILDESSAGTGFYNDLAIDDVSFAEAPSCYDPSTLTATNITATTVDLGWTENGSATLWNIEWGPTTFTQGTGTTITGAATNPYGLSGLTAQTTYDFYVQADCGGSGTSSWIGPFTFTTACATFIAPFIETFDAGVQPLCWTNTSSNPIANGLWEFTGAGDYGALANGEAAGTYAYSDGSTPVVNDMTLLTPFIDISGLTVPQLKFEIFSNNTNNPGDNVTFYADVWDGTTWNNVLTYAGDNASWQVYEYDLSAYSGVIQVRFITDQSTATTAYYNDILLDDVEIRETPTCPDPSLLNAANITNSSADLTWTENGTATMWNIEWGTTGFTQGSGTIITGATLNPYNLTGLSANTVYDFYVQADCGGDQSSWVGPFTFNTLCDPISTFPYVEDFTIWAPVCWSLTGGTQTCVQYNGSSAEGSFWGWSNGNEGWMTSPVFDVSSLTSASLDFDWSHLYSASYPNDQLIVLVTDDGWATSSTIFDLAGAALESNDGAGNTAPGSFVNSGDINLSAFGNTLQFRIIFHSGYGPDCFVDNFRIRETPACPDPSMLNAVNITDMSADLAWTENGTATQWNIEWGTTGFTQGAGTMITGATSNPYNITGLTATTDYDFYVQADCGGDQSAWIGPFTFTTLFSPFTNPTSCEIGLTLPDNDCADYLIDVATAPGTQLGNDVILTDVNFIIQHTWDSDIEITLESPNGVIIDLTIGNGGSGDDYGFVNGSCDQYTNLNMTGVDGAIGSGVAPFIGSYIPDGDFSLFNDGSNPVGLWTIHYCDIAGGDVGTLQYFELVFDTPPPPMDIAWSGTTFNEAALNDGSIENTLNLTLTNETFATMGVLTATTDYTVANVPAGLTVEINVLTSTTATVSLTGNATNHAVIDNISNMDITFLDAAFTGGAAVNVTGYSQSAIAVNYYDPGAIVMINEVDADQTGTDNMEFIELFDGGVGNTSLTGYVLVLYNGSNDLSYNAFDLDGYSTDANGYFVIGSSLVPNVDYDLGALTDIIQNGADAVALFMDDATSFPNGTAITTTNILDALVYDTNDADDLGLLAMLNPGQAQINEGDAGNSALHSCSRIANGTGGLLNTDTYKAAVPTPGASNTPLPMLNGDASVFVEAAANDGSISTVINLTLENETFATTGILTESTHYTVANVPAGLTAVIDITSPTTGTFSLTGNATNHANADDIANLGITFLDAAFTTQPAALVIGSSQTALGVDFMDPVITLTWDATTFIEAVANDGSISTVVNLTLANETFATTGVLTATEFSSANVPTGLTVVIDATSTTTATVSLTGNAISHADADDIANMEITFLDAAFTGGVAANVIDYTQTALVVDFMDPVLVTDLALIMPGATNYSCNLGATEQVPICIQNVGQTDILTGETIQVYYEYPIGNVVNESIVLTSDLLMTDTLCYQFATTVDFSALGTYNFEIYFSYVNDLITSNDSVIGTMEHYAVTVDLGGVNDTITVGSYPTTLDAGTCTSPVGGCTYAWSTTETTQTIDVNADGWYSVLVTDADGCEGIDSVYVILNIGVNDINNQFGLNIYPNPTNNKLNIEVSTEKASDMFIDLINVQGQLIERRFVENTMIVNEQFDVETVSPGVYYLKVTSGNSVKFEKVVIQ